MNTYDLGLFVLSISPGWFFFWLAVIVVIMVVLRAWAFGLLLLAIFLYNVTVWIPWPVWLPTLFTPIVLVTIGALIAGFFIKKPIVRWVAMAGAGAAMFIVVLLLLFSWLGLPDGEVDTLDTGDQALTEKMTGDTGVGSLQNDLDDLRAKRVEAENVMRDDFTSEIARLEKLVTTQGDQIETYQEDLAELQGQVDTLQSLIEDHSSEDVHQPHYVDPNSK